MKKTLFLAMTIGLIAAAGYAFHFTAARFLGPARYGEYTVLMALMLAFARPLEALSPLVAREIVESEEHELKTILINLFHFSLIFGLLLGAALIFFCSVWGASLGLHSSFAVLMAGLTILSWAFLFVFRGVLQGFFIDGHYLINRPVELFGRLLSGVTLFASGGGLAAAIFASLAGALAGIGHVFIVIKKAMPEWRELLSITIRGDLFARFLKIMLLWLAGGFFISLDMVLVRHLFPPVESGIYAIANLIGKGALIYSFIILPIIFPRLVKYRLGRESFRWLGLGILYSVIIFAAAFVAFYLWGNKFIPLFFGGAYGPAAALVPIYLIAVFPTVLNFMVINLQSAMGGWESVIFAWILLGFYFAVLFFCPPEINAYLLRIFLAQTVCAAAGLAFLFYRES